MTDKPTPTADLLKRCAEIHEWRSTGILSGEALRDYAKRKWPDHHDTLQMAEHETVTEALALLAKWGQPAQAAEPVALLVRKNSWRDGQWEAAPPNSPSYGLAWANQRVYVYTTPQPTQPQAGAVPLTDEYQALVCDYCGALTPDPWHSSGMLHGKMSKHIHSCDACAARGAAKAQAAKQQEQLI